MADEYPRRHKGPTNRDHIISGEATDQQMELDSVVSDLSHVIENYVPTTTMHYAVEDLRLAIKRYYNSPVIRTKDVPDPTVSVAMRNGAGDLEERNV